MGSHNLTLPVLFSEAPPAGLQVAHRRSIPQKCHLKFILRISQNMQPPKSIRIGRISARVIHNSGQSWQVIHVKSVSSGDIAQTPKQ